MIRRQLFALTVLVFVISGCGDGLVRVSVDGKLTVQGQPLGNTVVQFTPKEGTVGQGAIGMSDEQGKFTVTSSVKDDPGIPAGKYAVRLSRLVAIDGKVLPKDSVEADYPGAWESIPAPYFTDSSPLEITVDKGGALEIDLPAKLNAKKK